MKFVDFAGDWHVTSQWQEDAVTSKALEILGVREGLVVEFGAGDGLHLSNTAQYWRDRDWEAILIESDDERFAALRENTDEHPRVSAYHSTVGLTTNTIDSFLGIDEVVFMSIDVDDADFQVFESMECEPYLVLVEFNPSMPHHLELVGTPGSCLQSSPLALVRMAERRGYRLLSITGCNCLFVRADLFRPFEEFDTEYEHLVDPSLMTYLVADWHGRWMPIGPAPFGLHEPYPDPQLLEQR